MATGGPIVDMSVPYAADGLYSTVLDLHRWDQALHTDRLVALDVPATMFEPQVSISVAPDVSYGDGFFVGERSGRRRVSHGGGIQGFQAWYGRHPEDHLGVVFLANHEDAPDFGQLDEMVYDLVIGR